MSGSNGQAQRAREQSEKEKEAKQRQAAEAVLKQEVATAATSRQSKQQQAAEAEAKAKQKQLDQQTQQLAQQKQQQLAEQQQRQRQQLENAINSRVELKASSAIGAIQAFSSSAIHECIQREVQQNDRANTAEAKNQHYARSFADLGLFLGLVEAHATKKAEDGVAPIDPFAQKDVAKAFEKMKDSYRAVISQVQPNS